ncbi:Isoprenylcysteine carboxyl methyltransferase (ICMT) family domain containing protein [Amanita muscaria]
MTEQPQNLEDRLERRQLASRHPLLTVPVNHHPHGNIPNTPFGVATVAFLLGAVFSLGALTFAVSGFAPLWWPTYQLGFFVASWAFFHWAEFAVTAGWNLEKCSVDSFLLENGSMYHIANGTALLEYLLTLYFKPKWKSHAFISTVGMILVLVGQSLRSAAMIHASTNFSHSLATYKRESHKLVTDGVYAWFRHPSYAGFFYWALGTQLVLQNPLTFIMFLILLWRFFYYRTREEEKNLVRFFGDEYVHYRRRVGTKIPFIP